MGSILRTVYEKDGNNKEMQSITKARSQQVSNKKENSETMKIWRKGQDGCHPIPPFFLCVDADSLLFLRLTRRHPHPTPCLELGTEFRSEKIPQNRLGTVSAIPRKKVLIPRHSEFCGRANSEARNGTERNEIPRKKI
jgi:hypothetical protein